MDIDDDDDCDQEDDNEMEEDEEPSPEEQARAWMGLQQVGGGPGHPDDVCLCHSVGHYQGGKGPISVSISRIVGHCAVAQYT